MTESPKDTTRRGLIFGNAKLTRLAAGLGLDPIVLLETNATREPRGKTNGVNPMKVKDESWRRGWDSNP